MNKLLNVVLMLSAVAAVVPAQAVETRRQAYAKKMSTVALVPEEQDLIFQGAAMQDAEVQNEASMLNRKAVIAAAVAAGAIATAAYMYATAVPAIPAIDCNVVAQAYCAGAQVAPAALAACKANLPKIACWLF